MKALVTGGAGFLGHHLAAGLLRRGIETAVLDDFSAGDRALVPPGATLHEGDVRDIHGLWSLLKDVDVVFHLAARVSVSESILYPVEYNAVNTGGTVSLMTAARDAGVRRVVFASSAAVYGRQQRQPIIEDAVPKPVSPYAVSKLAAEGYVQSIGDLYRVETVILRVFNAYGSGQRLTSSHPPVIPNFVRRILEGGSLVLHGSPPGSQSRDFVHASDVVEALVAAGTTAGVSGSIFNIGSGRETTLTELVELLEKVAGRAGNVVAFPEHSGGVDRVVADMRHARESLGWQPRVSLEDGLAEMVSDAARSVTPPVTTQAGQIAPTTESDVVAEVS